MKRRNETHVGQTVQRHHFGAVEATLLENDRRPLGRTPAFVDSGDLPVDFEFQCSKFRDAGPGGNGYLKQADPALKLRHALERTSKTAQSLGQALRVVE